MWLLLACVPEGDDRVTYEDSPPGDMGGENEGDCGTCPCGMIPVDDPVRWCIDAFEADVNGSDFGNADQGADFPDGSTKGRPFTLPKVYPETLVSWYQAYALCQNAGKRLCTVEEWQDSCDGHVGVGGSTYPWGEGPEPPEMCATANADGTSDYLELSLTGAYPGCRTPTGIFDQAGNAWEWADPGQRNKDGTPVAAKVGGAFYAGGGSAHCGDAPNFDHPPDFNGTIGFRCCADPLK